MFNSNCVKKIAHNTGVYFQETKAGVIYLKVDALEFLYASENAKAKHAGVMISDGFTLSKYEPYKSFDPQSLFFSRATYYKEERIDAKEYDTLCGRLEDLQPVVKRSRI